MPGAGHAPGSLPPAAASLTRSRTTPGTGGSAPRSVPRPCRSPAADHQAAAGPTRQQPLRWGEGAGAAFSRTSSWQPLCRVPRGSGKGRCRATTSPRRDGHRKALPGETSCAPACGAGSPRGSCRTSAGNASIWFLQLGCASRGDAGQRRHVAGQGLLLATASNACGHRTEPGCESISLFAEIFSYASPERDIMCFVCNSQAFL